MIFFGMTGLFSRISLESLLAHGVEISAVILPTSTTSQPLPRRVEPARPASSALSVIDPYLNPNIVHLAWAQDIPVWEVGSLSDPQMLALLAGLQPDLIVVACFSYIFPQTLLQLPRYGCLNLHPSLLPAYRGPIPLFWLAQQGERQAGVTLHFIDEGLDTGDIVAQTAFDWPDGISGAELERYCAEEGAKLLLVAVQQLASGGQLPRRPQPQSNSSYFSWPAEQDLIIPTHWPARRAFNFVRAAGMDWPLVIEIGEEATPIRGPVRQGGGERFLIRAAISFDAQATLDQPYLVRGDELWVQFMPGILQAKMWL
jgi:methionyl-tRNA formyltransferase